MVSLNRGNSARTVISATLALALLAGPGLALAQTAASDVVMLTNGGMVRGTVMEQDPTRGVSVQMADRTVRQFSPSEVQRVQFGASGATPPPPAPSSSGAAPAPSGPPLRLEATNDRPLVLQRRLTEFYASGTYTSVSGTEWEELCAGTCDRPVPRNVTVRVAGPGVVPSNWFLLTPSTTTLRVHPGDTGPFTAGVLMLVVGIIGGATGGVLALGSLADPGMLTPGLIMLGAGAGLTVVGIVVRNANTTSVTQLPEGATARRSIPRGIRWIPGGVAF